jgi:hypothetical protein
MYILYGILTCLVALYSYNNACAVDIISAENIDAKIQRIMTSHKDERAIHTFGLKKFLQHSHDDFIETRPVIQSLRGHLCHPELPRILIADLGESVGFILDRLLRLEIKHLKFGDEHTSELTNQFNDFIGSIYEESGQSSVTATLLPIPSGDTIVWYALTCAHVLEMIELSVDHGSVKLSFLKPGLPKFHLESIVVFKKKPTRIVNIGDKEDPMHNTIYLNDIRALPRYDGIGGDIALCKLAIDPQMSNYLMMAELNITNPIWISNTQLRIEKYTDFYKRHKINIIFHFTDSSLDRESLVRSINTKPKISNFVLGLTPNKGLILSRARNPSTEIYPSHLFIDPNPRETLDDLCFFHDAPTCKGMSGGAIFQTSNQNQIDVFGIVKGCRSPRHRTPGNVTRCVGSFLQKQLFYVESEEKEEDVGKRVPTTSKKKDECVIT